MTRRAAAGRTNLYRVPLIAIGHLADIFVHLTGVDAREMVFITTAVLAGFATWICWEQAQNSIRKLI